MEFCFFQPQRIVLTKGGEEGGELCVTESVFFGLLVGRAEAYKSGGALRVQGFALLHV